MTGLKRGLTKKASKKKLAAGLRKGRARKNMTTAAAGNVAGHPGEKDKEKMEKRRALGRGLASLLPGPRVVSPPTSGAASPAGFGGDGGSRTGVSAPHVSAPQHSAAEVRVEGDIHGVADAAEAELRSAGSFDSAQDRLGEAPVPRWFLPGATVHLPSSAP